MNRNLVHPRMTENLRDFYPEDCVVQEAITALDAYGAETITWEDRLHTRGTRIRISPAGGAEMRAPDGTVVERTHTGVMNRFFDEVKEKDRLQVGLDLYDITLVEHDGQPTYTRLQLRVVK